MDNIKILHELRDETRNQFGNIVKNIILFGSQAEGTAEEYSDYDILIILNVDYDSAIEREIYDLCYEVSLKHDILIDAKIISVNELETIRGKQPYIQNALEAGLQI